MKYQINPSASTESVVENPLSVEGYAMMLEDVLADNAIDKAVDATMSVESNLIELSQTKDVKAMLESLSIEDCKELSSLFSMSVESLAEMPVEEFKAKVLAACPVAMPEASTEGAAIAVVLLVYFAVIFFAIAGAISRYNREQKFVKAMWRKLEQAFPNKEKALDEVVVHMWDAKTLESCLKNLAPVEKFLHNDMKTVLEGDYKLSDIEKLATGLWKSDLSYTNPDPDAKSQNENGFVEWWSSWKTNCPEEKGGSLRELGYTTASLESCCDLCAHYCVELMKIKEIGKEADKAISDHQKENQLGLWAKIKRWWTETKDQKKERLENERHLHYKYQAIYNLVWGYKQTIRAAAVGLYSAALKADRVIKAKDNKPQPKA